MRLSWTNILRVFFGAETLTSAYGYFSTIIKREPAIVGSFTLSSHSLEIVYVFAFVFGLLMLITLFWEWLIKWRWFSRILLPKSRAFGELYPEITKLKNQLLSVIEGTSSNSSNLHYVSKIHELSMLLQELDIPYPPGSPDIKLNQNNKKSVTEWCKFLIEISALSRLHRLKEARLLRKKINDE